MISTSMVAGSRIAGAILSPVNTATFAFYIIFGVWSLFQFLGCILVLNRRGRRFTAYAILLLVPLLRLAHYIMSAVSIVRNDDRLRVLEYQRDDLKPIFYIMYTWVTLQADILLAVALFVHASRRMNVIFQMTASRHAFPSWKKYIDGVLVLAWTSVMIAELAFNSLVYKYSGSQSVISYRQITERLIYARIAIMIATTLDITISYLLLWFQAKRLKSSDKNISYIALISSPVLLLRAFLVLSLLLVERQPRLFYRTDPYLYNLMVAIFDGLLNGTAIQMFLHAHHSPEENPCHDEENLVAPTVRPSTKEIPFGNGVSQSAKTSR